MREKVLRVAGAPFVVMRDRWVFDFGSFTGRRVKQLTRNPMDWRKNPLDFHHGPGV